MDPVALLITVCVIALVGLLVGLMLVFAGDKLAVKVDELQLAVRACLPSNNCGACGYAGCDALAAAIAKGEAPTNACPVGGAAVAEKVSAVMGVSADATEKKVAFVRCAGTCDKMKVKCNYIGVESCEAVITLPGKGVKACQYGCLGYGSCVKVCHFNAIHIVDGIAKVDRSRCVACGKCVEACPQKMIELISDSSIYVVQCVNHDKGQVVRKECTVGCFGCGACVRQCASGAISLVNNVAHIDYDKCIGCGKCAEKCPAKIIRLH